MSAERAATFAIAAARHEDPTVRALLIAVAQSWLAAEEGIPSEVESNRWSPVCSAAEAVAFGASSPGQGLLMTCECMREPDPGCCEGCSASSGSHCRCWPKCDNRWPSDDQMAAARALLGIYENPYTSISPVALS